VNCPSCGTLAVAGTKFCAECGTRLATGCPSCGTQNVPGAKFCVECGLNLMANGPVPPAPEQPVPATGSAERRLVSILFADLVGSTTLAEDRDPEETRELLTRYFDTCNVIIARYGGTVEKFIGDAVMAVWGVPVAHEDDAERAVRAALDLVAAVGNMTDAGAALALRAAVLTGEAAATVGASGQSMVAGDLVNTASRLQGAAPAGSVLVGEATWRATNEAIAYEKAGEQLLKGKAAPIQAWHALHVQALRGGAGRTGTLEPPFVGRDEELRLVKDLFHATGRERKPRLVSIIGQAGIGKHRLAWEFEKYLDGISETGYWHSGRSPAYGEGISFWALAEMVRERAGIAEGVDPDEARRLLAASVSEFVTDAEERRWIEPRLAGLLGLEPMPSGEKDELFAAWRTFFERIADRDPVIMVFGDLHWADQGLMDFIEHLLTWSRAHPILVIALARPELTERRPGWGTAVRNATTVTLEPLPAEAVVELLRGLVPGLPEDAVAGIVARSEGIPLYAVETVRMLLDTGRLRPEGDGFVLAGPLTDLQVPETLRALVAARLDANDPADRGLLTDAAVLGLSFTMAGLAGMTGREATDLEDGLDRLVGRELLLRDDDPRSPERGQYRFLQAVVREVAYESLAKKDRRAKHLAAARHLESLGDDELAGVLASHYVEAYRATPAGPEADALGAQARIALRGAAERAVALHSHPGAVHYLEDALTVTDDAAEQAALHERAAHSAYLFNVHKAIGHAEQAVALYGQAADADGALRSTVVAAHAHLSLGHGTDAVNALEGVLAATPEDATDWAEAMGELARAYMLTARNEEAVATADRALAAIGPRRLPRITADILVTRGTALQARPDEAEAILRGAVALAERAGHLPTIMRARNNLMSVLAGEVPLDEQTRYLTESADVARRGGDSHMLGQMLLSLVDTVTEAGTWSDADAALAELASMDLDSFRMTWYLVDTGVFHAFRGERSEAEGNFAKAAELVRDVDTYHTLGKEAIDALSLVGMGELARAAEMAMPAALAENPDHRPPIIAVTAIGALEPHRAHELTAGLDVRPPTLARAAAREQIVALMAVAEARWDDARAAYRSALEHYDALGMGFWKALAGLQFDAYLGQRFEDAREAGVDAESSFASVGAAGFVDRYRAAFKGTPAPPLPAAGSAPRKAAVPVDAEQPA
jgi:class 3 adenylate cyclase/tetratricopeptide (TPR) repeat protein